MFTTRRAAPDGLGAFGRSQMFRLGGIKQEFKWIRMQPLITLSSPQCLGLCVKFHLKRFKDVYATTLFFFFFFFLVMLLFPIRCPKRTWLLSAHVVVMWRCMWHTKTRVRGHTFLPKRRVSKGDFSLSVCYPPEKGLIGRKKDFCQADETLQWLSFNEATAARNSIAKKDCLGLLVHR